MNLLIIEQLHILMIVTVLDVSLRYLVTLILVGTRTGRHEQAAEDQDFPRNVIGNTYI